MPFKCLWCRWGQSQLRFAERLNTHCDDRRHVSSRTLSGRNSAARGVGNAFWAVVEYRCAQYRCGRHTCCVTRPTVSVVLITLAKFTPGPQPAGSGTGTTRPKCLVLNIPRRQRLPLRYPLCVCQHFPPCCRFQGDHLATYISPPSAAPAAQQHSQLLY